VTGVSHDPEVWQERANHLAVMLSRLAKLRAQATKIHATEFLAAEGTAQARDQAGKLKAADAHLAAENVAADVAAYQIMLSVWQADLANPGVLADHSIPEAAAKLGAILGGNA